ncbi:MAG: phosphoribosyl-ATP diphosphatase [bacterium]
MYGVIRERIDRGDSDTSYVARLVGQGEDAVLKKIGEECCEVILAAKGGDRAAAIHEAADLQFHLLIWMACADITPEDVEGELGSRFGHSGLRDRNSL